jgi:aldehyde dehydrogenase (NAD+)
VVFKPSVDVPHTGTRLVEILLEAGVPPEAVQLVHGRGSAVGDAIVAHPRVPLVSYTGSTEVGARLGEVCGRMHKRLSLEMGGKNAMIVMDDADLDLALEGVLWGAFGTTGQRCTATSRLILHRRIHDRFLRRLVDRVERLRLGDGLLPGTVVGPMINEAALKNTMRYVALAQEEGDELVTGGRRARGARLAHGWFHQPTVFAGVKPCSRLEQEEVFGPVLAVLRVGSLDEAIRVNNDVRYGLSSALYTRNILAACKAIEGIDAGITYINAPTIGAEAHLPFGGVKETGNGHREGGWPVYEFFSETKTVYVDYSGTLQRAQIDTYDV